MKRLVSLICLIAILALPSTAFCREHNNWADQMGEILTGKANTYLKGEVVKSFEVDILGADKLQLGVYTKVEMSKPAVDNQRYYEGGGVIRLIYE